MSEGLFYWGAQMQKLIKLMPVVTLMCIAALYWRVHTFSYVWDDVVLFVDDPGLRQDVTIAALTQRILPGVAYFRPLVLASFALEFKLFGLDSGVSHLVNLLIHILNTSLVGLLVSAMIWRNGKRIVFRTTVAMALYGLHPILVEPIAWAAGRFDLLVTFFSLIGLLALLMEWPRWLRYMVASFAFLAAALSKEMALVFPALAFIVIWAKEGERQPFFSYFPEFLKRNYSLLVALLGSGFIYLLIRAQFLPVGGIGVNSYPPITLLATVGHTVAFYLKEALWPFSMMSVMHPFDPSHLSFMDMASGVAILVAYLVVIVWILFFRTTRSGLMLVAFLCALLPVLNILPLSIAGNLGHARFITLPLAFLCMAIALLNPREWSVSENMKRAWPIVASGILGGFIAFGALNINITLPLWKNNLTLWSWMYRQYPDDRLVGYNYLSALKQYGDDDGLTKAFASIQSRRKLYGEEPVVYADYLQGQGRYAESSAELFGYLQHTWAPHRDVLARGISLEQAQVDKGLYNVGTLRYVFGLYSINYYETGNYEAALEAAKTMRFYNGGGYGPTWIAYGRAYYALGRFEQGDRSFQEASKVYPPNVVPKVLVWKQEALVNACHKSDLARGGMRCKSIGI